MKRLFFLLFLQATAFLAHGQSKPTDNSWTIIYIKDPEAITETKEGSAVTAKDPALQAILSKYTIKNFQKAYPASRFEYMQHYYKLQASSTDLLTDLKKYNPDQFPEGWQESIQSLYTPNDYFFPFISTPSYQNAKYSDYVNAREAWNFTHGSPSVVVGVTDTYFEITHPEFTGRIAQVRQNTNNGSGHGTSVAGLIAANTDNNQGLTAIGFNTKLDVSQGGDGMMLQMSADGRPILNASWFSYESGTTYSPAFGMQSTYNEIYENGTIPFFGAGNGWGQGVTNGYHYPSSLDHNMSITSIGHSVSVGTYNTNQFGNWTDAYWEGVHNQSAANDSTAYHHHDRVDLSAPGYDMPNLSLNGWYNLGSSTGNGTSFSAPICAGAAALLKALKPCLTPYQIEYILKRTANDDIYNIPYNTPYLGQLGAGRLDAGAAAAYTSTFPCDNIPTRTFIIKGIEINTVCAPGNTSNGVLPKLTPILENGIPPYTYKWEAFPSGNSATLDAYNIAEPTIISSVAPHVAYFRLTVYDNSPIAKKVANKIIKIQMKTLATLGNKYDLAMRDLYMDMLDEPNNMSAVDPRTWGVWKSPDIWNRQTQDGGLVHQMPEYYTVNNNFIYTKVRNVGCQASPTGKKLRLYWTMASTTESWKGDWDGSAGNYPGTNQPRGGEITTNGGLSIPALQPGESMILNKDGHVVNPTDYDPNFTRLETCLLARIEEATAYPHGMAISELINANVSNNVINNNNIVTHNTYITDLQFGNRPASWHGVLVGNAGRATMIATLQLINDLAINKHYAGDMSSAIHTTVYLGDLYTRWQRNGFKGSYTAKDDLNKTVTFDGTNTMTLEGIELYAAERVPIKIHYELINGADIQDAQYVVHFRQLDPANGNAVYGNVSYEINTLPGLDSKPAAVNNVIDNSHFYHFYPNPAQDNLDVVFNGEEQQVRIDLFDIMGRNIITKEKVNVGYNPYRLDLKGLAPGVYVVAVTDGSKNVSKFKIVKK